MYSLVLPSYFETLSCLELVLKSREDNTRNVEIQKFCETSVMLPMF